jgi:hypothetical protein
VTTTCRLCGQIVSGNLVAGAGVPLIGEEGRAAIEYQATIIQLVQHVIQYHPDYGQVLRSTADTYFFHLVAKLGLSTDPVFNEARDQARLICYWTLAGKFALEEKEPIKATVV